MPISKLHLPVSAFIAVSALFCAPTAFSELSWESRQLDFRPDVNTPKIDAEFHFMNLGQTPVTIRDVKTSCGCTTAALEKKVYQPGEKGSIKAVFTIGERVGLQQKQIMVQTDSVSEPLVQLTIRTFIPELVKWEPKTVRWGLNEQTLAKAVTLSTWTEQPMNILGVRSTDDRIFAKLKTVEPGRRYEVTIAPSVTTTPLRASVWMETDFPVDRPRIYQIPVEIGQAQPATTSVAPTSASPVPDGAVVAAPVASGQAVPPPVALGARTPVSVTRSAPVPVNPTQGTMNRPGTPGAMSRPAGAQPRAGFTLPSAPMVTPPSNPRRLPATTPAGAESTPNSQ